MKYRLRNLAIPALAVAWGLAYVILIIALLLDGGPS